MVFPGFYVSHGNGIKSSDGFHVDRDKLAFFFFRDENIHTLIIPQRQLWI